jgi:hypothetical protein
MMDIRVTFMLGRTNFFIFLIILTIISAQLVAKYYGSLYMYLLVIFLIVRYFNCTCHNISLGSVQLVRLCKVPAIADRSLSSLLEETMLLHWTPHTRTSLTQTVVTNRIGSGTLWTRTPYLVHAATFVVATGTVTTCIYFPVYAVATCKRRKPTANFISISPRYLGVESCVEIVQPGNIELQVELKAVA